MADDAYAPPIRPNADATRVRAAMEQWRRRSRLIHFLRKALPVGIALVSLSLVGWVGLKSILASLPDASGKGALVRMTNPRFYGQDDKGRSFVMGGREAVRDNNNKNLIGIVDPVLKLSTAPSKTMDVVAKTGTYDQASHLAHLTHQVHIVDGASGWIFDTGEAVVDSKAGLVSGNSPVTGHGPLGQTSASSYAIYDHGARVVFTGNVHSLIVQRR
jgi:lipopolysaccharide export system protein LptC